LEESLTLQEFLELKMNSIIYSVAEDGKILLRETISEFQNPNSFVPTEDNVIWTRPAFYSENHPSENLDSLDIPVTDHEEWHIPKNFESMPEKVSIFYLWRRLLQTERELAHLQLRLRSV
jgi:hypothetical protein